ncbi:proliferating cell nuclear antigen (pcna) [Candidatus Woesearchaeota archaeon CG10_big_fil_rev_8_21_14_0_10_34_8]|jgi:proliferating cell nuclear antigen|nr:MAG: proliferating cell nuclear antigen (pcna) [Candidatus Woesearchaeota archaeon CG10_big_fil_rev_8_21_14_0_10_34_8]
MKLTLAEPRLLKESINIISELVNEVTFKIDSSRIELIAMDPANVAMVDFKLLSTAFAEYEVKEDLALAVNLDNFKAILKRAKPTDSISLSLDKSKNRLTIELVGENKRTFNLALLNIDENNQKIPNLNFGARIETSTSKFDEAIEDMDVVAESVSLVVEGDNFTVRSESNFSDASVVISATEETQINAVDKVSSKYSIEYLKKIIKGSKLADNVVISFGQDYPLKVEYVLLDKLKLGFILAPRVSND